MDWIQIGTLIISGATLGKLFYDSKNRQRQLEIDRRISVIVNERRRMQKDLFDNLNLILNVDKKIRAYSFKREDLRVAINEISSYKINIWINLNRDNKYYIDLRNKVNELVCQVEEYLHERGQEAHNKYTLGSESTVKSIWSLTDSYVNEEERLVDDILKGN